MLQNGNKSQTVLTGIASGNCRRNSPRLYCRFFGELSSQGIIGEQPLKICDGPRQTFLERNARLPAKHLLSSNGALGEQPLA